AGAAGAVSKVEVVAAGIVKVHRLLDQAQTEHAGVEIDRALGIAAYNGNVVESLYPSIHRVIPFYLSAQWQIANLAFAGVGVEPISAHESLLAENALRS